MGALLSSYGASATFPVDDGFGDRRDDAGRGVAALPGAGADPGIGLRCCGSRGGKAVRAAVGAVARDRAGGERAPRPGHGTGRGLALDDQRRGAGPVVPNADGCAGDDERAPGERDRLDRRGVLPGEPGAPSGGVRDAGGRVRPAEQCGLRSALPGVAAGQDGLLGGRDRGLSFFHARTGRALSGPGHGRVAARWAGAGGCGGVDAGAGFPGGDLVGGAVAGADADLDAKCCRAGRFDHPDHARLTELRFERRDRSGIVGCARWTPFQVPVATSRCASCRTRG